MLAHTRHAAPAPDRVRVPRSPLVSRRVPLAAAAVLLLVGAMLLPRLLPRPDLASTGVAERASAPEHAVAVTPPGPETPGGSATTSSRVRRAEPTPAAARAMAAAVTDSLFDHAEDVEFVLDPVLLRRGRAHKSASMAEGLQTDQAVISF